MARLLVVRNGAAESCLEAELTDEMREEASDGDILVLRFSIMDGRFEQLEPEKLEGEEDDDRVEWEDSWTTVV
jgi:hypothetical protein